MLYSANCPNFILCFPLLLEILVNICILIILIICIPLCDVIRNFEIIPSYLIKAFFYMITEVRRKTETPQKLKELLT